LRISCPFCGPRDLQEFVYLGDARGRRSDVGALQSMIDYVYLRDNPAGLHREYWQHVFGCRSWLIVARDTRTHEIESVEYASVRGQAAP
jgi:methylglutamate dehydrogenase subunit B